jgi:tetratricopeptide (TPR) repeat protein
VSTLGALAESEGLLFEARRYYQESLDVRRELQDLNGAAFCIYNLGRVAYRLGELDAARQLQIQSTETLRTVGASHGIPDALQALAEIAYRQGERAEARALLTEACATRRTIGEVGPPLAWALLRLGDLELELAESAAAQEHLAESLALFEALGDAEGRARASARLQPLAAITTHTEKD